MFGRATIRLGIGPHSSSFCFISPNLVAFAAHCIKVGSMGVGAGLYMYDIVVEKFTFAISSPDEFLYAEVGLRLEPGATFKKYHIAMTVQNLNKG